NFNGGELQLSANITTLPRAVTLNGSGGTIDTGSFTLTSSGTFSGTGGLVKLGSGSMILTGTASYTGGTTVAAGTLRGNTSNLQGNIVNSCAVTFAQVSDGTDGGVMSGTGALTKLSGG